MLSFTRRYFGHWQGKLRHDPKWLRTLSMDSLRCEIDRVGWETADKILSQWPMLLINMYYGPQSQCLVNKVQFQSMLIKLIYPTMSHILVDSTILNCTDRHWLALGIDTDCQRCHMIYMIMTFSHDFNIVFFSLQCRAGMHMKLSYPVIPDCHQPLSLLV